MIPKSTPLRHVSIYFPDKAMQAATSSIQSSIWHWKRNKNLSIPVLGYVNLPGQLSKAGTQMLRLQPQKEPKLIERIHVFKGSPQ